MLSVFYIRSFALLLGFFALATQAASGGAKIPEGVNYISLGSPIVVSYASSGSRLRYIKAELAIRCENAANSQQVMQHLPLIRDRLIGLLSQQNETSLASPEGKEALRQTALQVINQAIHRVEFGAEAATEAPDNKPAADLLFNNLVIQ